MMSHNILPSQQKLAEKLTILNDRGIGMLTRISNIKKACSDKEPGSKPKFLLEKSLETTFKQITKKFPNFEKGVSSQFQSLQTYKTDILKSLSLYYHTFVDLLDFKDHVNDLLTTIGACQLHFDIALNFDLTKNYLDLIVTYVSLMVLLSKVEDRKIVLGLFTIAHEMINGQGDASFPRLGQMIVDYENPMKKLIEDFVPHSKLVYESIQSLYTTFKSKNINAEELRRKLILNLSAQLNLVLQPPFTDTINCDYLSFDQIERWIVFASPLCLNYMNNQECMDMFKNVLVNSHVHALYRDDWIQTHPFLLQCLEANKSNSHAKKLIEIVKETQSSSYQNARLIHHERRQFLRMALRELSLLFTDQPGLLGPKALYLFMGLSMARDEVNWLLRHQQFHAIQSKPVKQIKNTKKDDWIDKHLPELLFFIEELRALTRKYSQIIQRYHVEYLNGADSNALNQALEQLTGLPEDETILLSSFASTINGINLKQIENNESINLKPLRLDWFRFQTYTSVIKNAQFSLMKYSSLAKIMNTIAFHSKLVDNLDELLLETSDLSIFCFYPQLLFDAFQLCFDYPIQLRYSIAFPLVCTHFINCTHELCPEERQFIGRKSIDIASRILEDMARETRDIILEACNLYSEINSKLQPHQCLPFITEHLMKKQKLKDKKSKQLQSLPKPGNESIRSNREDKDTLFDRLDRYHTVISEWCFALNYTKSITVWEYTFHPCEYLFQQLEARFNRVLVSSVIYETGDKNEKIRLHTKPSDMLNIINSYMFMLLSVENYVHVDMTKAFNSVLLQQTQVCDVNGQPTLTKHYCDLYVEKLLKNIDPTHVVYSPLQKNFIQIAKDASLTYTPEDYINYTELLALCEIIGVIGAKYMFELINKIISENVIKLKEIVVQNKEILQSLRIHFDRPDIMKEAYKRLENVDVALGRLLYIGILLAFKNLLAEALSEVLDKRLPYLMSSALDISKNFFNKKSEMLIHDMMNGCGYQSTVDTGLFELIGLQSTNLGKNIDEEYNISCLLMVLLAVSLPRLIRYESSIYRPDLQAHCNNAHCIANTINVLASCLFYENGAEVQRNVETRLTEFLALASSALLKLIYDGNETTTISYSQSSSQSTSLAGLQLTQKELATRDSVYIILDQIIQSSPYLTYDLLESCFPYALIRSSYRHILKLNSAPNVGGSTSGGVSGISSLGGAAMSSSSSGAINANNINNIQANNSIHLNNSYTNGNISLSLNQMS